MSEETLKRKREGTGMTWHVEKRGYSRGPWRLIHTLTGLQISRRVPYPDGSLPSFTRAGFDRKQDAVAHAEALDWDDIERRMKHEGVWPA